MDYFDMMFELLDIDIVNHNNQLDNYIHNQVNLMMQHAANG